MINEVNIKKVQELNLYMLKTIDDICKKYDIKYRLEAGTLLGAYRHKGFIPWDDDVDIVFKRLEYEKFLVAFKKESPENFIYDKASERKTFREFIDRVFYIKEKIRDNKFYEEVHGGLYQYPWVDIWILDDCIENKFLYRLHILKLKIIYGLAMGHRMNIKLENYSFIGKLQVIILSNIGKFISLKYLYEKYESLSKKYNNKNYKKLYYSNYPISWLGGDDYTLDKEKEEDFMYVDFENIKLPVVRYIKELLEKLYPDFMALPKKEEQVPGHVDVGEF